MQRQLADRTVRPGEEEFFKSKARETGSIRIIDIITARLDAKTDSYIAELPSLRLRDVRITPALNQTGESTAPPLPQGGEAPAPAPHNPGKPRFKGNKFKPKNKYKGNKPRA